MGSPGRSTETWTLPFIAMDPPRGSGPFLRALPLRDYSLGGCSYCAFGRRFRRESMEVTSRFDLSTLAVEHERNVTFYLPDG